jgi:hypothetical protein
MRKLKKKKIQIYHSPFQITALRLHFVYFSIDSKDYGTLEDNSITSHNLLFATYGRAHFLLKKMTLIVRSSCRATWNHLSFRTSEGIISLFFFYCATVPASTGIF